MSTGVPASRAPVVVVGLGPVGATVALLIARAGVPVVAIERDAEVYPHPRAVALDDDALRVLQAAGIRARPEGAATWAGDDDGLDLLPGGTVRIRGRGGRSLVELGPPPTTNGHPGLAFFRQPQLERALRALLEAEQLVDLRLGTTVLDVVSPGDAVRDGGVGATSDGDGPDAVLRVGAPDGTETELRAAWVLACDGGRSPIRTALGVRLHGTTSPSRWLVVDTDAPVGPVDDRPSPRRAPTGGPAPADRPFVPGDFEFGADPAGPWVHGPLPSGAHRWEFLLDASTDAGPLADPAVARALLARRMDGPVPAVHRSAVYAFHARIARRLRVGRVVLLGDAAHLAPPFAGQGLCAGLRDAGNVAWKVAAAWSGVADERLLDTYASERLPHVVGTTALAVALGAVVELRRPRAAAVRDAVLGRVASTAAVRGWIGRGGWRPPGTLRRGLVARDRRRRQRAGEPLPQPRVGPAPPAPLQGEGLLRHPAKGKAPTIDPSAGRGLDDALPVGWVLLGAADAGPLADRGVTSIPWDELAALDELRRWIAPAAVVLVRPDRIVYGTASATGTGALLDEAAATAAFSGRARPNGNAS